MLLLIDNYDSFTWNLAQYFGELGARVKVVRNDEVTAAQIGLAPGVPGDLARAVFAARGGDLGGGDRALCR